LQYFIHIFQKRKEEEDSDEEDWERLYKEEKKKSEAQFVSTAPHREIPKEFENLLNFNLGKDEKEAVENLKRTLNFIPHINIITRKKY